MGQISEFSMETVMRTTGSPPSIRLISSLFALALLFVLQGQVFHAQGQQFTPAQLQQQRQLQQRQNVQRSNLQRSLTGSSTDPYRGRWNSRPGAAVDIGVGANGSVWVIGTNRVAKGFGIYRWTGRGWQNIPGGAVRIAVDPRGIPWVVNSGTVRD